MHHRSEVRLDRVQVIWLTLGMLVALGVVFALGVVIGRRGALLAADPHAGAPISELNAAGDALDELTFYDRLTSEREQSTASVKRPPPRPVPPPRPEPDAAADTPSSADPDAKTEDEADPTPPAEDPDAAIRAALQDGPARKGDYTIQVYSFQSMAEARASAASLERKGYEPFVVKSQITGKGTWYRVRLGRFGTEAHAKRAKSLLAGSDLPAWVLRTE